MGLRFSNKATQAIGVSDSDTKNRICCNDHLRSVLCSHLHEDVEAVQPPTPGLTQLSRCKYAYKRFMRPGVHTQQTDFALSTYGISWVP